LKEILSLKNIKKIYKIGKEKITVLDNVNLSILQGEICCILGTSGSGKSTLLNMMAGLEQPCNGTIHFKDKSIEKMNENQLSKFRQQYVGFVFQSYNLISTLTALENVCLPLIFRGTTKLLREKKATAILKAVGLEDRLKHKPTEMSGGQQQRVGIARAFIHNPQIIFADEPTGNLDTHTTEEMMGLMISMTRRNNQTLIIVTHDLEIARYADRIIHMRDGNIERITLGKGLES
jgi:putative ABC transport system ATP-binding protein